MPDSWKVEKYRNRARMWREKADTLPEGPERDACLALAEGYANLAGLIDKVDGSESCANRDD
jgi:hypothetical protein